jgi:hypothetical protein
MLSRVALLGDAQPQASCAEAGMPCSATGPSAGCYPFYKTDPFIFLECPHIYFCGNTPSYGSKIIRGKFCFFGDPRGELSGAICSLRDKVLMG